MKIQKFLLILLLTSFALPADAWGPLTHLTVNMKAYEKAVIELGRSLGIPPNMKDLFIGGGPSPDIKQSAGNFPPEFHNDLDTVTRMIELAKKSSKYGVTDVVEALGYAGHLFAEVTSAHTDKGYPNNNMMITVAGAPWANHMVNELAIDILVYTEFSAQLNKLCLTFPIRLLEESMKNEKAAEPGRSSMTAAEIKSAANAFMPSVLGIRSIAEYLTRNRPELVEEMKDFHSDRWEAIDQSVSEVQRLLRTFGKNDYSKSLAASVDSKERIRLPITGDFGAKVKTLAYSLLGKITQWQTSNDIFVRVAAAMMKPALGSSLTREKFMGLVRNLGGNRTNGKDRTSQITARYIEGLLLREDLTYPEIIAFAQEGLDADPQYRDKQLKQFAGRNLRPDGRKPADATRINAAIAEVERVEAVRRDWPWFWPWRPSTLDLSKAREHAGRLLAYHIADTSASAPLVQRARQFLAEGKELRSRMLAYKVQTIFNPIAKYNLLKDLEKRTETYGKSERFFLNLVRLTNTVGGENADPAKINALADQANQRIEVLTRSLNSAKELLNQLPFWNLVKRDVQKTEIARLEGAIQEEREVLAALDEMKAGPVTTGTGVTGTATSAQTPLPSNLTDKQIQAEYEKVYSSYVQILGSKGPNDPETMKILAKFREIEALRSALKGAAK